LVTRFNHGGFVPAERGGGWWFVGHGTTAKWFFRIKDGVNPGRLGHYPWG